MTATVDLIAQGNQAARAWALTHILEESTAPPLSWSVSSVTTYLSGRVDRLGEYDRAEADIRAWAAYLKVEPTTVTSMARRHISAEGRKFGSRVRVWAWISDDLGPVA